MTAKIIQLTHYYSRLRGSWFYAVRTDISLEDLNLACAYLQLLRYQLPSFLETVEDDLGEVEAVPLLSQLYRCESLISRRAITTVDGVIDLYDNWNEYVVPASKRTAIGKLARPGAKLAILEEMLKNAKRNMTQHPTPKQAEIIKQLEAIKSGSLVSVEWGLKTLNGNPYVGRIVLSDQPDLL